METSTSKNGTKSSTPGRRSGRRSIGRWWIGVIAAIGTAITLFLIVAFVGSVQGVEFSPANFRTRSFSFYEIPFLEWQVTAIHRRVSSSATASHLRQQSLINIDNPAASGQTTEQDQDADDQPIWHLVSLSRGGRGTTLDDAEILVSQLKVRQADQPYWKQWSIDHAAGAKVLWPIVQKLASRELYVMVPQLLEIAQQDLEPAELREQLDQAIIRQYRELIVDAEQAGRKSLASTLRTELSEDYGQVVDTPANP